MRILSRLIAPIAALCLFALPLGAETFAEAFAGLIPQLDPQHQARFAAIEMRRGVLPIGEGAALLTLPDAYYAISGADAQFVLHDLWGNPANPSTAAMILQTGASPMDVAWVVALGYFPQGHISDIEAATMDFEEILANLRETDAKENVERAATGAPTLETLGWVGTPGYDRDSHSLHFAMLVRQTGRDQDLLNAHAMVLGRYGYVEMNVIGDAVQAAEVDLALPGLIKTVSYNDGFAYADFIPGVDTLSEGGLSALMGDGTVAQVGFFVLALAFLKKGFVLLIIPAIWLKAKFFPKKTPNA